MKSIIRWVELNLGWFFVNGRKQAQWAEYLRNKYYPVVEEKKIEPSPVKENKTKGNTKPRTNTKKSGEKPKVQPRKKKE